jgi:hypothetical protein
MSYCLVVRVPETCCTLDWIDEVPQFAIIADPNAQSLCDWMRAVLHLGDVASIALHASENAHLALRRNPDRLTLL